MDDTAGDTPASTTNETTSGSTASTAGDGESTAGSGSATTGATGSTGGTGSSGAMDGSSGTSGAATDTGVQGMFPCGDMLECDLATQYCQQTVGGAVGNPPSYACMDLPDACGGGGTCECVAEVFCGDICEMIEGGVQVTCQAP